MKKENNSVKIKMSRTDIVGTTTTISFFKKWQVDIMLNPRRSHVSPLLGLGKIDL